MNTECIHFVTLLWHGGCFIKTVENPNIRISPRSKAVLRTLAKREGKPMQAVLDEAIEHYQRDKFLDDVNAAFANLRSDPKDVWSISLDPTLGREPFGRLPN